MKTQWFALWLLLSLVAAPLAAQEQPEDAAAEKADPAPAADSENDQPPKEEPTPQAQADLLTGQMLSPKAFRAAAEKVLPSVVTIESFGGVSPGTKKGAMGGIRNPGDGPTTGLIVSPDGYVVTSTFNFIRQQPIITVVMRDGTRKVAKLLGRDETRKLCILKINNVQGLPVPEFVKRDDLRVGQWAISLGVGFGDDEPAVSAGIISARNRVGGRAMQTDANISPANYGGPLVDIEGRVIGICVPLNPMSQETTGGVEWYDSGIGFAVPLHGADKILAAMKEGKIVQPAQLGIQVKPAEGDEPGAIVEKVMPDSAAAKAGIQENDRIVTFAGQPIAGPQELRAAVGGYVAGDKVEVVIKRKDMSIKVEATLDAAKAPEAPKPELPFKLPIPRER